MARTSVEHSLLMRPPINITLPRNCVPAFPNECIVCHCIPHSTLKIAHNAQNPLLAFFLPFLLMFGWSRVEVPVCRTCKLRFRLQRWGREVVVCALILASVWLIWPCFKGWHAGTRRIVGGVLVLLLISPYVVVEVFWPRFFNTYARKDSVDYAFASPGYAAEFHELNLPNVLNSEVSE